MINRMSATGVAEGREWAPFVRLSFGPILSVLGAIMVYQTGHSLHSDAFLIGALSGMTAYTILGVEPGTYGSIGLKLGLVGPIALFLLILGTGNYVLIGSGTVAAGVAFLALALVDRYLAD